MEIIIFNKIRRKRKSPPIRYKSTLKTVLKKYLGILLHNKLTMRKHILKMKKKANNLVDKTVPTTKNRVD